MIWLDMLIGVPLTEEERSSDLRDNGVDNDEAGADAADGNAAATPKWARTRSIFADRGPIVNTEYYPTIDKCMGPAPALRMLFCGGAPIASQTPCSTHPPRRRGWLELEARISVRGDRLTE